MATEVEWSRWHVWWGDERMVPADHEDSNERMARSALLDHVAIPEQQLHPLRETDIGLPDRFDLVLLGIGTDGHTASLFPGDPGWTPSSRSCGSSAPTTPGSA